ncbi:LnmK family bifunctional acyltransferase/decarboxylase [Actinoplanes sp. NPDC051851]|uniref:LnmK family bifunctional acyltransferase/decarboxylase n=1 Tax=Actinoplanes sp. NPDC051851 TaxID=3154753 RepID=UPI00343660D5
MTYGEAVWMPDASSLSRRVVVTPGMSGGGSLLFGRIGDWTWDAVSAACGTDVHAARNQEGEPAYLSFYYYRIRGGTAVQPHGLEFGDRLQASSRVFDFGSRSALTLHRLAPAGLDLPDLPLEAAEFHERPHPACLYAETFNRWVSRTRSGSNRGLAEVSPPDFAHEHLPRLANEHSPRTLVGRARQAGTFHPGGPTGYLPGGSPATLTYALDPVRDLNGAGLVYFASFFSIFDTGLLALWRAAGRGDAAFVRRRIADQRIGFFGNADVGTVFTINGRRWLPGTPGRGEIADLQLREAGSERLVAVASIELAPA